MDGVAGLSLARFVDALGLASWLAVLFQFQNAS